MTEEEYPFTFTPPIVRYLKEIITGFENRNHGVIGNKEVLPFSICFETYEKGEQFLNNSENMRKKFIDYLESQNAVKFELIKATDTRVFDSFVLKDNASESAGKYEGDYNTNFVLHILNMNPIHEIWSDYSKNQN